MCLADTHDLRGVICACTEHSSTWERAGRAGHTAGLLSFGSPPVSLLLSFWGLTAHRGVGWGAVTLLRRDGNSPTPCPHLPCCSWPTLQSGFCRTSGIFVGFAPMGNNVFCVTRFGAEEEKRKKGKAPNDVLADGHTERPPGPGT